MSTLFTEDFQREEGRFSGAMPAASPTGGTQALGTRRT
jgi:hypothetical protein